jgi:toxin YhaV
MEVKGWRLFQHKLFKEQFDRLIAKVERICKKKPTACKYHRTVKLLARIVQLIADEIPTDPASDRYNLGTTLGTANRFWKRAKFGRYRLFFRYDRTRKLIIYAWVNDKNTLRKEGDKNDPYVLFAKGLKQGNPPTSIDELLKESDELEEDT